MSGTALDHAQVRVFAPVIFTAAFVLGALLQWLVPIPVLAGTPRWAIGAGLVAIGLGIGFAALGVMNRAETSPNPHVATNALVERGPFRMTRNPMYVSMVLIFAGLALMLRTTWAFIMLVPAVIVVQLAVIKPEERYLESKFGESYTSYKSRVRSWF